jgi:hypothetical protein
MIFNYLFNYECIVCKKTIVCKKYWHVSKEVDWSKWSTQISSKGFVEKIKTNYTQLRQEQYQVDAICKSVLNT